MRLDQASSCLTVVEARKARPALVSTSKTPRRLLLLGSMIVDGVIARVSSVEPMRLGTFAGWRGEIRDRERDTVRGSGP
jgi:hypothetical protein